jgi:hypothetical protein
MSHVVTLRWEGDPGGYGGRRSRASFTYEAFVPDPIAKLAVALPGDTALLVSLAESEIRALNSGPTTGGLDAVGALLLRAESVASSRIEGLELSQRNLARALFDPSAAKGTAKLVAGNVRAMEEAVRIGSVDRSFTAADITDIHRTLLAGTDQSDIAGQVRTVQNWVGGRLNSPIDAEFVPPPPEEVPGLLKDLVDLREPRGSARGCPGGDRSRPVRNHPPIHRWQRPGGSLPDPCHSPTPRARADLRAASVCGAGNQREGVCPRADRIPRGRRLRSGAPRSRTHVARRPTNRRSSRFESPPSSTNGGPVPALRVRARRRPN